MTGDLGGVPKPGDIIADKYRLERVLGKGAAGIVFEATHELIGRRVALKWLFPHLAHNEVIAKRFLREAKAANAVDHPGVVEIFDAGREGDSLYLVMELLRGEPLSAMIERGVEDPEDFIQVLMPALRGIAAAHDHDIVHRDLKPDNIFLCVPRRGRPGGAKVLDFGISKLREGEKEGKLTSAGTYLGSPYYMAPEQIADSSTVDVRADVYSIGVILYQAFTGAVPYDAESLSGLFFKITNEKPAPISTFRTDVSEELEAIVMRAMSAQPDDRFATVRDLAKALEPYAGGAVFATLDEALGDALGDALAARRTRAGDTDEEDLGELEGSPTMVSSERVSDTDPPPSDDAELEGRSTLVNIDARDTNPEAGDDARDTDPSKTPADRKAPATNTTGPRLSELETSPTLPLIKADEVEGAPTPPKVTPKLGGQMSESEKIATARTFEMQKPAWDDTSLVGRSIHPRAPAKKPFPWAVVITSVVVVALTAALSIAAMR